MRAARALLLLALVAVLSACGGSSHSEATTTEPASPSAGFVLTDQTPAPSFRLRDEQNRLVGPQTYRGRWVVVTFLYTHCPDVCPLIANQLAAAGRQDAGLRVLAVSVDPARDTLAAVRTFLRAHHAGPNFHYVIGKRPALAHVWGLYHVAALAGPSGTVSHNAISVLIDPKGHERVLFDSQVTARAVLDAMRTL
jgi:protein SCO1